MLQIAQEPEGVPEDYGVELVAEAHIAAIQRARSAPNLDSGRDRDLDAATVTDFAVRLREMPYGAIHNASALNMNGSVAVLNDLDWEATTYLMLRAADMIKLVRDVPVGEMGPSMAAALVEAEPYRFLVGATDINNMVAFGQEMTEAIKNLTARYPDNPPISIQYHIAGRPSIEFMSGMLVFPSQVGSSIMSRTFHSCGESAVLSRRA
ncbi:hypothetical protein LWF15_09485 [Kineosporia rhizophila]|uniref:hypothetical protein n=1 Tax=Kineosporia rhizophila TaxID=84633 RepID=UPI001E3407F7|nr:hypothetical protein [Kineosporia rhizophila]MCE0535745.1 hypothetical protein [Kineosporia rhizophila]